MTPTREQVGAIICSVLMVVSVGGGLATAGSVAAADEPALLSDSNVDTARLSTEAPDSANLAQVDVNPRDLAGSGTKDDPYQITNASELQAMEDDLNAHYELTTDIDASHTAQWNDERGFDPVGGRRDNSSTPDPFSGSLDGNNHTITGLTIDRPNEDDTGFFGVTSGRVTDASLTELSVTGAVNVGGLVGSSRGTIANVRVTGNVNGREQVGGLVGITTDGEITNARVVGDVNGRNEVGGIVGSNRAPVINATASASVNGTRSVGGLIGKNIHSSRSSPNGTITNARASGSVKGNHYVGGLVGNTLGGIVQNVKASGNVTRTGTGEYGSVGGLVGSHSGTIQNATASGSVTGTAEYGSVGGLVGSHSGTIQNATASGSVTGTGELGSVGGLVGTSKGTITNAKASGDVNGTNSVGGLVGDNEEEGTITSAKASGSVTGIGEAGGIVGRNDGGTLRNVTAFSSVNGTDRAGGLVGTANGGTIQDVFATGRVSSTGSADGLVGAVVYNDPTIIDAYWDKQATGQSTTASNTTGLTTAEMTGGQATANMPGLAYETVWNPRPNDYPELAILTNRDVILRINSEDIAYQRGFIIAAPTNISANETIQVTIRVEALTEEDEDNMVYGAVGNGNGEIYGITSGGNGNLTVETTIPANATGDIYWTWVPAVSDEEARSEAQLSLRAKTGANVAADSEVAFGNDGILAYQLGSVEGSSTGPSPVVGGQPPVDPNGDGLYEDVDGNSQIDGRDVLAVWNNRNTLNSENFDYDNSGTVDGRDVLWLWNHRDEL